MIRKNFISKAKKIKKFKLNFPIHPFLFAVFPLLSFYSYNIKELTLNVIITPVVIAIISTASLLLALNFLLKNRDKSSMLVTLFILLFFSYGHVHNIAGDFNYAIGKFNIGTDKFLLPIFVLIFLFGTYLLIKTRRTIQSPTNIINIISIVLVTVSLVNIGLYEFKTDRVSKSVEGDTNKIGSGSAQINLKKPDTPPDIYYLIFDRYANNNVLKEFFKYDNTEFTDYLTNEGFYVATESTANYPKTHLSLASSLNLKHLTYLTSEVGKNTSDQKPIFELMENNEVSQSLKSIGYKFVYLGNWWEPTRTNKYADVNYNFFKTGLEAEFGTKFLETTMLSPVIRKVVKKLTWDNKVASSHLYTFDKLKEMPKVKGPKFVYAHMLFPHDPYLLDHNCQRLTDRISIGDEKEKEAYLNQLICTNKKIKEVVDEILSKSKKEPIIILQSDEGPFVHSEFRGRPGLGIDWSKLSAEALSIHMQILNAYYLPKVDKSSLRPSTTPVNSFRIIFNEYFKTNLDLLPDKNYIIKDTDHPYYFIEVTEKLK